MVMDVNRNEEEILLLGGRVILMEVGSGWQVQVQDLIWSRAGVDVSPGQGRRVSGCVRWRWWRVEARSAVTAAGVRWWEGVWFWVTPW